MFKNFPPDLKKIKLDTDLFNLHKDVSSKSSFGMDNTPALFEGGFGLYSTTNTKKGIGPIKTDYFRISLTRKGSANFNVGIENYQPSRNWILFGIPGQIFSLKDFSDDFLAYYMLFSEAFIGDDFQKINKQQNYPFLTYAGLQCFELNEKVAGEIEGIMHKIDEEIKLNQNGCSEMLRLYIQQILVHASRNYDTKVIETIGQTGNLQSLFNRYIKLVNQHYLTLRKVSEYAHLLHVSADHLNRAIRSCSDKTAHEFIDEMILMEAKYYLLYTPMTIAEIAYKLEFADPPHFNRAFKKLTLCTPLEFRNRS